MSRSIDRKRQRMARNQQEQLERLLGDEEAGQTALLTSGALAELSKGVGGIIAEQQQKKAAKAAAEAAAKKDAAAKADENAAARIAADARKAAAMARAEAMAEADPNGPAHKRAEVAEAAARVAEAKLAFYRPGAGYGGMGGKGKGGGFSIPWWGWALGGVVVIGGGVALARRK